MKVFAHRGLSAEHAENTLAAFKAAADADFDGIELDVRVTADGEVVCLHDAGIERTTDGGGRVADMGYDELRGYDTTEGPVPRLDDVFDALGDWPGAWNIEIKTKGALSGALDLIEEHALDAHITSMDPAILEKARKEAPNVQRGLIVLGPCDGDDLGAARAAGCAWVNPDAGALRTEALRAIAAAGFKAGAWTINDVDRAQQVAAMGVDAIITDMRAVRDAF